MTAPPIPYFGGKQTLAPRIAALFPPHSHYVEPFAGSLAVLLAKPPSAMETVNDLDGDIICFWKALRDHPGEFERLCALTPHSRAEYNAAFDRPTELSELERARRVWVGLTQGRGSTGQRTGWRHYVTPVGNTGLPAYLSGYIGRVAGAAARLVQVSLECRPALELVASYGQAPDVLLYVDPPYPGSARAGQRTRRYRHEMIDDAEHRELLEALLEARAAVVISGYPCALYDQALIGWYRTQFTAGTGQSAAGEWSVRTEVLWSNRPLGSQASLFDVE